MGTRVVTQQSTAHTGSDRAEDIDRRRRPLRSLEDAETRYVWCDFHGDIHGKESDPYGVDESNACNENVWRTVYIASTDPEEEL